MTVLLRMSATSLRWIALGVLVVFLPLPAYAVDSEFAAYCDRYATDAVAQATKNQRLKCGNDGPRWDTNRANHFNWCIGLNGEFGPAAIEGSSRVVGLKDCQAKIDAAQKPVKKLGKLKTTKVAQDVDVYAAPDPADDVKPIGALNFGDVVVWVGCTADKKWCHITKADPTKVPGGDGWVYDGTDRRSLDR